MSNPSIVQDAMKDLIETELHPHVVKTILYDHHVENRLDMLTHVEKVFEQEYGVELFIQCDVESRVVTYEVEQYDIVVECGW